MASCSSFSSSALASSYRRRHSRHLAETGEAVEAAAAAAVAAVAAAGSAEEEAAVAAVAGSTAGSAAVAAVAAAVAATRSADAVSQSEEECSKMLERRRRSRQHCLVLPEDSTRPSFRPMRARQLCMVF
eukprot:TRINITY_DN3222_c0_g1_i1.p2 TRINITY_DN3222_c0_g1~~TRINITY_DN3222_c0_g1_i1.p2  ORF type:complete len:129 (-),score=45.28 TRINITY_DN3222_c0_g1_i1:532-918(-)